MNRTEVLQESRLMKFDDIYLRRTAGKLMQQQAAEILGVSIRTVRRWEERFEADGASFQVRLTRVRMRRASTVAGLGMR